MITQNGVQNSDSITIILTFAIVIAMFVGMILEKLWSGELLDC